MGVSSRAIDYEPGENESATETAKNIAALLAQDSDELDGEENQEVETELSSEESEGNQEGDSTLSAEETPAQRAARQRDENGRFIKGQQQAEQKTGKAGLEIPSVLTDAAHRKAFMNMPEGLRKTFNDMIKGQQAHFTRKTQEASGVIGQAKNIVDSGTHYINTNNLVDPQGVRYTPERLFGELLSAHNNLATNPDYYIAKMIKETGASAENIGAYLNGENPTGVNISADPTIKSLQNEVKSLKEMLGQQVQASTDARIAPAAQEFSAVMHEVDQNGEYVRPELQDDDFLESTKPIVAALLRTNANLSRGEALKRAYATLTGKPYSQNGTQPILPARSNNLERARSAAVSVRGRIAPMGAQAVDVTNMASEDIPESATETARMIYRGLLAG